MRLQVSTYQETPFLEEYQSLLTSIQQVDTQNQIIQQIISFVHKHYAEHFTISKLAESLGYSESYLYKVIKEDFPMTLNEYILRYRLKQAIDKMADSHNSPLSNISEQVGFSDYKYFAKVFKKYLHISPKELKTNGRIVK